MDRNESEEDARQIAGEPLANEGRIRICARGTVRRVSDESIGEFDIPGLPVKFSRWAERSEIARLGEHNEAVLLLALTDQEIAGLYADKVLVRDPLLDTP